MWAVVASIFPDLLFRAAIPPRLLRSNFAAPRPRHKCHEGLLIYTHACSASFFISTFNLVFVKTRTRRVS